jgi:hypothetical protein
VRGLGIGARRVAVRALILTGVADDELADVVVSIDDHENSRGMAGVVGT